MMESMMQGGILWLCTEMGLRLQGVWRNAKGVKYQGEGSRITLRSRMLEVGWRQGKGLCLMGGPGCRMGSVEVVGWDPMPGLGSPGWGWRSSPHQSSCLCRILSMGLSV